LIVPSLRTFVHLRENPRNFHKTAGSAGQTISPVTRNSIPGAKLWATKLEGKMSYSISYDIGLASVTKERCERDLARVETFLTEDEALNRAFRLLDEGMHHGVSVRDSSGNVLCGVRLQLKLGFSAE
jgi:hypothetical protein